MRKAGGTTARRALKPLCESMGVEFGAIEGRPMSHANLDDDVFVVINYRHPVERICSLYNTDGTWMERKSKFSFTPFDDWLNHKLDSAKPGPRQLWINTSDYFVRSLCDRSEKSHPIKDLRYRPLTQNDYRNAIVNLQRVNLVLMTEWLGNRKYLDYLSNRLLGTDGGTVLFGHENRTTLRHNYDIRDTLSRKQRQDIEKINRWDLEFYRYLCWREASAAGLQLKPRAARGSLANRGG
jgi:hypothetical protein